MKDGNVSGAAMVVGGGVSGIQAALDLADSGFYVYLVEKTPAIGGVMGQLDKTFPTIDCSMCILSPYLVYAGRHPNIELDHLFRTARSLRRTRKIQGQGQKTRKKREHGALHRVQGVRGSLSRDFDRRLSVSLLCA